MLGYQKGSSIKRDLANTFNISQKKLSVAWSHYSMGCSLEVRVLDKSIPLAPLREFLEHKFQRIRTDGYGEILSGCNQFVHVSYRE